MVVTLANKKIIEQLSVQVELHKTSPDKLIETILLNALKHSENVLNDYREGLVYLFKEMLAVHSTLFAELRKSTLSNDRPVVLENVHGTPITIMLTRVNLGKENGAQLLREYDAVLYHPKAKSQVIVKTCYSLGILMQCSFGFRTQKGEKIVDGKVTPFAISCKEDKDKAIAAFSKAIGVITLHQFNQEGKK